MLQGASAMTIFGGEKEKQRKKVSVGEQERSYAVCLFSRSPSSALYPFLGEGSPTKMDYRKKGTLILTSLLEDLVLFKPPQPCRHPTRTTASVHPPLTQMHIFGCTALCNR